MQGMSFAILRHSKIKSTGRGAAISHNHRLGDVDQVNIDKDRKHLNRWFMGDGLADRINALLPEKIRKDAVVSVEVLLTSGPEFFDAIDKDREKLAKNPTFLDWVAKSLDWAKKEFGSNLVDATLHMDESTPHIHLMAVPRTRDGRLCAKEVMARVEMQRRQTGYAEVMRHFGLARGEPAAVTKRRHIGLKEAAGSGGKVAQLEAQLAKAKADLARLQTLSKQWSDTDLARCRALEAKLCEEVLKCEELEAKVATLSAALGTPSMGQSVLTAAQSESIALEASKTALEALQKEWPGILVGGKAEVSVGALKAIYGRFLVLHIGRGKHVFHEVPKGQEVPRLGEAQQHSGLEK